MKKIILAVLLILLFSGIGTMAFLMKAEGSLSKSPGPGETEPSSKSRVVINEVCSKNFKSLIMDDGTSPDWIELYNEGDTDENLTGFVLKGKEGTFTFPPVIINAKGYMVVPIGAAFKLPKKGGYLCLEDAQGRVLSEVEVPALDTDMSYSRTDPGFEITEPTPNAENAGEHLKYPTLADPIFSKDSGFYDRPFYLRMNSGLGSRIYYTLDGSTPGTDSLLYTGPIYVTDMSSQENFYSARTDTSYGYELKKYTAPDKNVDKAFLIRARAVNGAGEISEVVSRIYFIGYDEKEGYEGLPVVSVVAEPGDLYDDEEGIYVLGNEYKDYLRRIEEGKEEPETDLDWIPGNFFAEGIDSEREALITGFNEEHEYVSSQKIGIRIKGNSSKGHAQKSLNLYARKAYGKDHFDPSFFEDRRLLTRACLYSCSQDFNTKIEDSLVSALIKDTDVAVLEMKPCQVFINGEYSGLYQLTENIEVSYISEHYGVPDDEVIIIKEGDLKAGRPEDQLLYEDFKDFVRNSEFSEKRRYEELISRVDIESLMDYYLTEIYISRHADWPGYNVALWRTRSSGGEGYMDGKWRYILYDVNGFLGPDLISFDSMESTLQNDFILPSILKNQDFREDFMERLREMSQNEFSPENTDRVISELSPPLEEGIGIYYDRYYSGMGKDRAYYKEKIEGIRQFFRERSGYIIPYCEKALKDIR